MCLSVFKVWYDIHGAKSAGVGATCRLMDGQRVPFKFECRQQEFSTG